MNQRYQYVCCLGPFCHGRSRGGNAMMSAQLCLRGILLFVCLALLLSTAHAQYRAGIQGTILDPDGAAVGAATVTLTSKDTSISKTATSDSSGIYNFLSLAPGHYVIAVEKAGFKKKTLDDVLVAAEQTQSVNITLELGDVTQSVTVRGETAPLMD